MMSESIEETKNNTDLATILGGLMSNPELTSKMGEILSGLSSAKKDDNSPPSDENSSNNTTDKEETMDVSQKDDISFPTFHNSDMGNILAKLPQIISNLSGEKDENSLASKQQIALLLAIRPYLSQRRQELIDTFIKMNRFGAIFKNLS